MSPMDETPGEFERQVRSLLEDGVGRIDGRVRSRLNQARHAALAEYAKGRPGLWRRLALTPAAGAVAAAVLIAFVLWPHSPGELPGVPEGTHPAEDLDLLADSEGLDLVSEGSDGAFYEWAVEQQADQGETST